MNQPTTPNSLIEALEMIAAYPRTPADEMSFSTMRGIARAALADRAQRPVASQIANDVQKQQWAGFPKAFESAQPEQPASPTVAGSVDVDELSNFIRTINGNNRMGAGALAENIAEWFKAGLAPAAPSGDAVAIVTGSSVQWLPSAGKVADRTPLYTHPAPSSPTAQGLPAQAVPEGWTITDDDGELKIKCEGYVGIVPNKNSDNHAEQLLYMLASELVAQVAANKQQGK